MTEIGGKVGIGVSGDAPELNGVIRYLESEGLIELDHGGYIPPGRKLPHAYYYSPRNQRESRDNPQTPTEHFPPYQQIIYDIAGNYSETDRVMGDVFTDIQNATIINKSLVENSFNKAKREYDEETSNALVKVDEFIEKSKNPVAGALFDSFNQELNKTQPDKSRLESFLEGVKRELPSIAAISESVAKIASLFA